MKRFAVMVAACAIVVGLAACGSSAKKSVAVSAAPTTTIAGIKVPPLPPGQTIPTIPTTPPSLATVPPTVPPTLPPTAAPTSCVGLKAPLPAGAPAFPLAAGPAPTTLGIKDLKTGTGAAVASTSVVTANYIGVACSTGQIFDASYSHQPPAPVQFPLNQVIPGWTQGVPGMRVGGVRMLSIPPALAYGPNPPQGAGIAPNEPLFFLVEITKVG